MEKKGTVTSLSSLIPPEEAQKSAKRVEDTINELKHQLDLVNTFISDNNNLINLVRKLPNELHHDIMVPFGKAAFFPGRLIHTNEFKVLLGEGYYVDGTSKQTFDILKRRGNQLDSQVDSLKAFMQSLKAEASFFDATANEGLEGLVEIREDYIEESHSEPPAKTGSESAGSTGIEVGNNRPALDDEEYERIFARLEKEEEEAEDEDEKEEEEAEEFSESDDDEPKQNQLSSSTNQIPASQEEEVEESSETDEDEPICKQPKPILKQPKLPASQEVRHSQVEASIVRPIAKDISAHENYPTPRSIIGNKPAELPKVEKNVQAPPASSNTAFTNSIVERTYNLDKNAAEPRPGVGSSKPVSRFRMQRNSMT